MRESKIISKNKDRFSSSEKEKYKIKNYDYGSNGLYFVTVCTKDKNPILSKIVGDDALIVPKKIILKPYGEIVEKHINRINDVYDNITVENYIIMPNHIHILIFIDEFQCGTMRASSPTKQGILKQGEKYVRRFNGYNRLCGKNR